MRHKFLIGFTILFFLVGCKETLEKTLTDNIGITPALQHEDDDINVSDLTNGIDLDLSLEAQPGNLEVVLNIVADPQVDRKNGKIVLHGPIRVPLEFGGPEFKKEDEKILWKGDFKVGKKIQLTHRVVLPSDTLHQLLVAANYTFSHDPSHTEFSNQLGYYIAVKKSVVIIEGASTWARDKEVEYELEKRGLANKSIQEIKKINPKLAWIVEHPHDSPDPKKVTTEAPNGDIVEYTIYPEYMLDKIPPEERIQYNNREYAIQKHMEKVDKNYNRKGTIDKDNILNLPPIEMNFPEGFEYTDVPDSLMKIEIPKGSTPKEEAYLRYQGQLKVKEWLEKYWKKNR